MRSQLGLRLSFAPSPRRRSREHDRRPPLQCLRLDPLDLVKPLKNLFLRLRLLWHGLGAGINLRLRGMVCTIPNFTKIKKSFLEVILRMITNAAALNPNCPDIVRAPLWKCSGSTGDVSDKLLKLKH
jgi:hypothetical protein